MLHTLIGRYVTSLGASVVRKNVKDMSSEELSDWHGKSMQNSPVRNEMEGEFRRRELYWIRAAAISAIISLFVMGISAIVSTYIDYIGYSIQCS